MADNRFDNPNRSNRLNLKNPIDDSLYYDGVGTDLKAARIRKRKQEKKED